MRKHRLQTKDIKWIGAFTLVSHYGVDKAEEVLKSIFPAKLVDHKLKTMEYKGFTHDGEITKIGVNFRTKLCFLRKEYRVLHWYLSHGKSYSTKYSSKGVPYDVFDHVRYFDLSWDFIKLNKRGKGRHKFLEELLRVNTSLQVKDYNCKRLHEEFHLSDDEISEIFPEKIMDLGFRPYSERNDG